MAKIEHTWPADELDTVGIRASDVTLTIHGIDGDEVILKVDGEEKHIRALGINQVERWLKLHTSTNTGKLQLDLQLPKNKAWGVDVFSVRADFQAEDITARLNLTFGTGKILVERCRGTFTTTSGNAGVRLRHFTEAEIPVISPLPEEERRNKQEYSESKQDWGKDYWAQWGLEFGEKIIRSLFGQTGTMGNDTGIRMKLAKGDLQLEETEAETCVIRAANGDVNLNNSRISKLDLKLIKGDLQLVETEAETCVIRATNGDLNLNNGRISKLDLKLIKGDFKSNFCVPGDDWIIRTNYGNIFLSLAGDVIARLDVATRQGEIHSKAPLVRVTRQGPEAWHGSRMVGTVGTNPKTKEKIPELNVSTLKGDIKIETQSVVHQQMEKPESPPAPPPPPPPPTKPPAGKKADLYKTQMDILQALREGRINVDEAERLLDNLGP